tara:strand:+ start:436 stop:1374 length:939 start_codon:yes stop_codon:yes gene_type:complete
MFILSNHKSKILVISILAISISLLGIIFSFLNPDIRAPIRLGIDFKGGSKIEVTRSCLNDSCSDINAEIAEDKILSYFREKDINGFDASLKQNFNVQLLNKNTISLKTSYLTPYKSNIYIGLLDDIFGPLDLSKNSVTAIGPKLGVQLLKKSLIALVLSLIAISLYISIRFDKRFAILALLALFHDLLIVFGVFSWLGILLSVEVNSLFAVSLLTVAGYSVNDTVVIFDRIRENTKLKSNITYKEIINMSVSESLSRTIFTSFTTILPLLSLMILGSNSLFLFSLSLFIGIIVGSWSSICLAPSLLLNQIKE